MKNTIRLHARKILFHNQVLKVQFTITDGMKEVVRVRNHKGRDVDINSIGNVLDRIK